MAQILSTVPNMYGELYLGEPMTLDPKNLSEFKYDVTNVKYQTTDIQRENDVNSEESNIYGSPNAVTQILGNKVTYSFTMMVVVDDTADSLFMRLHEIELDPTNSDKTSFSYLARGLNPKDGTPIPGDYFCPEATVTFEGSLHFGAAGEKREITVTLNESLPGKRLETVPGTAPESPIPPATPSAATSNTK
jgi:hypothetical protein